MLTKSLSCITVARGGVLAATMTTLILVACGVVRTAQMEQPAGIADVTRAAAIEGLGGGRQGTFRVDGNQGTYSRSADRLELFGDTAVFDRGGATFRIEGPDFPAPVAATCTFRRTTAQLSIVGFTPRAFEYACRFDGIAADLVLQEGAATVQTLQAPRRGYIRAADTTLTLHSEHRLVGAVVPVAAPAGYVMERGGVTRQAVATIELNGMTPQLRLPPRSAADERRAALLAALAVALLWDPAAR